MARYLMKNYRVVAVVFALCVIFSHSSASANNDEELQQLINTCADCHGAEGKPALPGWLPIANMSKEAIVGKLVGHRAKLIDDSTMSKVAHDLSDEQIDKIATYYSSLKDSK